MITYKHNGEYWYADRRSAFNRARQWLIWFGGWEKAKGGWKVRRPRPFKGLYGPTPVAILGHRVTFFGDWLQVRLPNTIFVLRLRACYAGRRYAYCSHDGTPHNATVWWFGAPHEVVKAVRDREVTL